MLVAVGTVVTITNVLSATTQHASASFTITYEANNVYATVSVASKTQSQNDNNYSSSSQNASKTFYAVNTTIPNATLNANEVKLGFDGGNAVFERYAVYRFTFSNLNPANGRGLNVEGTFSTSTMSNVILLWITSDSPSTPQVPSGFEDKNNSAWPDGSYGGEAVTLDGNGNFTVASDVAGGDTVYLYLYVAIDDVSLPITFNLGGANNILSFKLTPAQLN